MHSYFLCVSEKWRKVEIHYAFILFLYVRERERLVVVCLQPWGRGSGRTIILRLTVERF